MSVELIGHDGGTAADGALDKLAAGDGIAAFQKFVQAVKKPVRFRGRCPGRPGRPRDRPG